MDSISTTCKIAAGLIALYGLGSVVGGIMGYVKAGSVPSLAAGVPSGLLLLACAAGVIYYRPQPALVGAIIFSLPLVGFFGSNLVKHRNDFATFVASSAGVRSAIMLAAGLIVIIVSIVALVTIRPTTTP